VPPPAAATPAAHTFTLLLALRDEARLAEATLDAASPHPRSGYLSVAELAERHGRSVEEIAALKAGVEALGGRVELVGSTRLHLEVSFPDDLAGNGKEQKGLMGGEGLLPSARAMKEFGGLWEGVLGGWHKSVVNSARLVAGDVEEERLVDVIHVSLECRIAHAIQQKSGDHSVELVFKKSAHDKTTMPSSSSHKTAESPNSRSGTDSSTSSTRRSRAEGESFRDGQFNVKEQPERRAAPDYKVSSEVMNPVQRLSASVNFFNFLNDNTLFEAGVISPEAAYANLDTYNYQQQFWVVCDDVAESASNPCVTDVIFDVVQRYFAPDDSTTPLEQNSTVRNSSSLSSFQRQTCLEFFEERGGNGTLGCELNGQPEDSFVYSYNILEDFGNLSGKTLAFVPVVYFSDGRNLQPDFSSYLAQFGPTASAANMKEFYRMPKGPAVAEGQIVMLTISPGIVYYMAPEDTRLNAFLSNTSVPEVEVLSELFWTAENIESKPEAEASLDVQTAATLAEGAILQFTPIGDGFAVSPTNPGDTADILAATDWMLGIMQITDELPNIVSMSFGAPMIPKIAPVIEIIDRLFLMMTALGVTVVASSGDDGSCEGTQGPTVVPEYPGSRFDPFIHFLCFLYCLIYISSLLARGFLVWVRPRAQHSLKELRKKWYAWQLWEGVSRVEVGSIRLEGCLRGSKKKWRRIFKLMKVELRFRLRIRRITSIQTEGGILTWLSEGTRSQSF